LFALSYEIPSGKINFEFLFSSWISKHAGKTILTVSAIGEKRKWLDGLFDIVRQKTNRSTFLIHNLGLNYFCNMDVNKMTGELK